MYFLNSRRVDHHNFNKNKQISIAEKGKIWKFAKFS